MEFDLRAVVWLLWKADLERKQRRKVRRGPLRDPKYREWIRTLPCTVCGSSWRVEAAHTGSDGGMSMKPSDYSCIPLCRYCHTGGSSAYHKIGKPAFEQNHGLNLKRLVRTLNSRWASERQQEGEPLCWP